MTIPEFMKLFDKKAIEDAKVSFTVHAGLDRGGKWVLWCEKGETAEEFFEHVASNKCLNDIEIDGFQRAEILPQDEDSVRIVIHAE